MGRHCRAKTTTYASLYAPRHARTVGCMQAGPDHVGCPMAVADSPCHLPSMVPSQLLASVGQGRGSVASLCSIWYACGMYDYPPEFPVLPGWLRRLP
jgi:hypothetical protein